MYPAVRYATRLAGDPPGTLTSESSIIEGGGSQSGYSLSRRDDYSAMTVDPSDDCTFRHTNEYLKTTGAFNWSAHIDSFKVSGCQ